MRMRGGWIAWLALASLSCASDPTTAVLTTCPKAEVAELGWQSTLDGRRTLYDTNGDGYPDRFAYRDRVEVDSNYDGRPDLIVGLTEEGAAISWERLPRSVALTEKPNQRSPSPLELAPLDFMRLIPDLQPAATPGCLAGVQASKYLGEIRDVMYSRWSNPPPLDDGKPASFVVRFSLARSGELTGVCLEQGDPVDGANVVRALLRGSPYDPVPEDAMCLTGHRLVATFTAPLPPATR